MAKELNMDYGFYKYILTFSFHYFFEPHLLKITENDVNLIPIFRKRYVKNLFVWK